MADIIVHPECSFSATTFDILAQLKKSSLKEFYLAHEEEYKNYVEKPFQKLYSQVKAQLSGAIIKQIALQGEISSRLGYGIYEYRLYKEGADFQTDNEAYLYMNLSEYEFLLGLFVCPMSPDKQRFIDNYKNESLKDIILRHTKIPNTRLRHQFHLYLSYDNDSWNHLTFLDKWLNRITRKNGNIPFIRVGFSLDRNEVIQSSSEELCNYIIQAVESLFPLFLLATDNNPIRAIDNLRYVDLSDKYRANLFFEEGVRQYQQGNYQESILKFNYALEKAHNLANVYVYRGLAKAKLGDTDGAILDYNHLLLIQPKNAEIYKNRGNTYYKLRDYEKAIQDYNQALNINPNFALAYYHRGCTYLQLENQQRAIEDLRRAVELFEQEKDMDKYEEAQRILKTIQPDYSEPSFTEISQSVRSKGLHIAERTLRRYHLALKSRKFVILSGISGTGKTWLTKAYADTIEAEYLSVPVAPNWTTNEDLLGYLSPIDNKYHDTDFSTFLEKAEKEYQEAQAEKRTPRPYHLVLDEMNLARVEYYFAKFLSAMEVRMREGVAQIQLASEKQVLLPPNLYFIGTVNVDETTRSFADKVYDRAQLIELEAPRQDLYEHLGDVLYHEILMHIWDEVHTVAPFAFRVLDEIKTYVKEAEALDVSWQDALDEQLLQKILPKLKGADDRVGVALKAFVDIVNDKDFPLSHKKATKMLETFNQHGFTSYF